MENKPTIYRKPKLSIPEQIEYMKDSCGISFNIVSENDAIHFLSEHTYFFKIKTFAKNYRKVSGTEKYNNLEFAYLMELSKLDAYLRKVVLSLAVDTEHYLKVWLIKDISARENEDGYEIVSDFINTNPKYLEEITTKSKNSYCSDLVKSLDKNGYALWNYIELLSFGVFMDLFDFYCVRNNIKHPALPYLYSIKHIRNAAAHNNCLINSLRIPYTMEDTQDKITAKKVLASKLSQLKFVSNKSLSNKLENPVIHDLSALLYTYKLIAPPEIIEGHGFNGMHDLVYNKMIAHADYFKNKNAAIESSYNYIRKLLDKLEEK